MKVVMEINRLTSGFIVNIENKKGKESFVFESSSTLGSFIKEYFDRPIKPRVIRRRKGLIDKTPLVNGDSLGA